MRGSSVLRELEEKKREVEQELRLVEEYIYEMETSYLTNAQNCGNIVKGYEPLLAQKLSPVTQVRKPGQKSFRDTERIFSLSSLTNRRAEEDGEGAKTGLGKRKGKDSKGEPTPHKKPKKKSEDDSDFSEGVRS